MEEENYGLDALERYAAAIKRFLELRQAASVTETKLDAMIAGYTEFGLEDINKVVDEYSRICGKLSETDKAIGSLYDASIRALDDSFKHTCEVRLPRIMLSFISNRKAQIRNLYFIDD